MSVDGVKAVHSLRTRSMGSRALVDVHILVKNPRISVSEGHQISEAVLSKLKKDIDEVYDVTVHIDPEDDEVCRPAVGLPLRKVVESDLARQFSDNSFFEQREETLLHYLDGKVLVELVLPIQLLSANQNEQAISRSFESGSANIDYIDRIEIRFK